MRPTSRLLAAVSKTARYLEPNSPTGLTGLLNHPAPRSALIYLYSSTLDALKPLPPISVYRTSTEALTRHRLAIVESIRPAGYEEWSARGKKLLEEHPEMFTSPAGGSSHYGGKHVKSVRDGKVFITTRLQEEPDERLEEWDGEEIKEIKEINLDRTRSKEQQKVDLVELELSRSGNNRMLVEWESEPALTADQVAEMESQIGAGLIEEVIQVAEGELKLVTSMAESKVWEELEEKPAEGQWKYFSRGTHTDQA